MVCVSLGEEVFIIVVIYLKIIYSSEDDLEYYFYSQWNLASIINRLKNIFITSRIKIILQIYQRKKKISQRRKMSEKREEEKRT